MKSKTLNPKAEPRRGELIILARWRKRREPGEQERPKKRRGKTPTPQRPADALPGDVIEYVRSDFDFPLLGLRVGDVFATYRTQDVEAGDCISIIYQGGIYFDKLVKETATHICLMGPDQSAWVDRSEIEIVGRVVGVWRRDRYIKTAEPLRAIHPIATLYQFKRRA